MQSNRPLAKLPQVFNGAHFYPPWTSYPVNVGGVGELYDMFLYWSTEQYTAQSFAQHVHALIWPVRVIYKKQLRK